MRTHKSICPHCKHEFIWKHPYAEPNWIQGFTYYLETFLKHLDKCIIVESEQ